MSEPTVEEIEQSWSDVWLILHDSYKNNIDAVLLPLEVDTFVAVVNALMNKYSAYSMSGEIELPDKEISEKVISSTLKYMEVFVFNFKSDKDITITSADAEQMKWLISFIISECLPAFAKYEPELYLTYIKAMVEASREHPELNE